MTQQIEQFSSDDALATAVADALVVRLEMLQKLGRTPRVMLTGGRIAARIHAAIAQEPGTVNWENVEVWFTDERFLLDGDPERNYQQADAALFSHLPFDYSRLHEMPSASDGFDNDAERAAREHAAEVLSAAPPTGPWFDIALLSVGPDGHCAALFPGRVDLAETTPVVAVHNAPKLPSTRLSMSMDTLCRAREVWWLATGAEKAAAVADALSSPDVRTVPAAGPTGLELTRWFLDDAAAGRLGSLVS